MIQDKILKTSKQLKDLNHPEVVLIDSKKNKAIIQHTNIAYFYLSYTYKLSAI